VIVVDNASEDDSIEVVESFSDKLKITLIQNEQPVSPTGSRNQGISEASGKYLVFIDSDAVLLSENVFPEALEILRSKKRIGGLGGKVYYWDTNRIEHLGLYIRRWDATLDFRADRKNYFSEDLISDSDYLSTCFAIVPRAVIDKVGGFDDYYEWMHEDLDLFYRIKSHGYELLVAPSLEIIHKPTTEGRYYITKPIRHEWIFINNREMKNRIYFLVKNLSRKDRMLFPFRLFRQSVSFVRYILQSMMMYIYFSIKALVRKRGK